MYISYHIYIIFVYHATYLFKEQSKRKTSFEFSWALDCWVSPLRNGVTFVQSNDSKVLGGISRPVLLSMFFKSLFFLRLPFLDLPWYLHVRRTLKNNSPKFQPRRPWDVYSSLAEDGKLPCRVFLTVAWQDVGDGAPEAKKVRWGWPWGSHGGPPINQGDPRGSKEQLSQEKSETRQSQW